MTFAKRNKNAVGGCNKSPEKENGNQGAQRPVIRWLFCLTHNKRLDVLISDESRTFFVLHEKHLIALAKAYLSYWDSFVLNPN